MERYIGSMVEIIYQDRSGEITQRRIRVRGIKDGMIRATYNGKPRVFRMDRVLAFQNIYDRRHTL